MPALTTIVDTKLKVTLTIDPAEQTSDNTELVCPRGFLIRTLKLSLLLLTLVFCPAICFAQTQSKCFAAEWLQGERSINLTISGTKVSGTFLVESGEDSSTQHYNFTGTRRGNVLTVAFADSKLPDISPSELKGLVWMLTKNGKLLRMKVYGRNYQTNKYENSFAYFRWKPCGQETK